MEVCGLGLYQKSETNTYNLYFGHASVNCSLSFFFFHLDREINMLLRDLRQNNVS